MSAAIYRLLLRLYPEEIRRRWEEEMVETFALQLADGWWDAWCCAVGEIFQIALPLQLAREGMAIPIVSLASSGAVFFGRWGTRSRCVCCTIDCSTSLVAEATEIREDQTNEEAVVYARSVRARYLFGGGARQPVGNLAD
jgi:hypothetical protein